MKKTSEPSHSQCQNCGASVSGAFCQQCGQSVKDHEDRSMGRLVSEFLGNLFFLDNRLFLSTRYLLSKPGKMTVEFLEGKRRKFLPPVSLFLLFNLIYFTVNPLTDYSLAFYDQVNSQPYSPLFSEWVKSVLESTDLSLKEYSVAYQSTSDSISKTIMIINIPMMAILIYLMSFRKRKFYYDSLIYAFHFFSFFIFSLVMFDWFNRIVEYYAGGFVDYLSVVLFVFFTLILPVLYGLLSMRQFLNLKWYWAILAGLGVCLSVAVANFFYRFIIFALALQLT